MNKARLYEKACPPVVFDLRARVRERGRVEFDSRLEYRVYASCDTIDDGMGTELYWAVLDTMKASL